MGIAGSMAHGTVEALFHFVDTVNIKSKATETESHSTMTMVRKIWAQEGIVGFGRGIGAACYGNYTAGFVYFVAYKWLKTNMPHWSCKNLIAGVIAETGAILYKFPFDLVKCRLQSVNYIFKYTNWQHGFQKEYRQNGIRGLYCGVFPYLLTYTTFTALQFSIYEKILVYNKSIMPQEEYERKEFGLNMVAGGCAGGLAAGVTNALEAITVVQQTNPSVKIMDLI